MKAAIPILLLITTVLACDDKGGADDSGASGDTDTSRRASRFAPLPTVFDRPGDSNCGPSDQQF